MSWRSIQMISSMIITALVQWDAILPFSLLCWRWGSFFTLLSKDSWDFNAMASKGVKVISMYSSCLLQACFVGLTVAIFIFQKLLYFRCSSRLLYVISLSGNWLVFCDWLYRWISYVFADSLAYALARAVFHHGCNMQEMKLVQITYLLL